MAIISDSGIEIAVMIVERSESRKTRMIKTAKARPSPPSTARSWMDCSIDGAWSKTTWIEAFWPRPAAMPVQPAR